MDGNKLVESEDWKPTKEKAEELTALLLDENLEGYFYLGLVADPEQQHVANVGAAAGDLLTVARYIAHFMHANPQLMDVCMTEYNRLLATKKLGLVIPANKLIV